MIPSQLRQIIQKGEITKYSKGQVFHSLDFNEELYVVRSGFAKRYSMSEKLSKSIESIYGPNHFFPLTPVFINLFGLDFSQPSHTYVYQAMTDIELNSISNDKLMELLQENPELYADLLYETGKRLKVDVQRLTSNALKDDYKKVTYQLVCLAEEFGGVKHSNAIVSVHMPLPLQPIDMAEQVNVSEDSAADAMAKWRKHGLTQLKGENIYIPDMELLRDSYLRY